MSNEQHNTIDTVNETGQLNKLGFWVFLTAEVALFGTLFATFLVLQKVVHMVDSLHLNYLNYH